MPKDIKYNSKFLWLICLVAAMGGFLFGYDWVVVGGAKPFYEPYFDLTTSTMQGWGTSSALIGCIVGAFFCVFFADKYGRRKLLVLAGFWFTFSSVGTALSNDFTWYNIYRIFGGFGIGITLNLSPMYISEMSPQHVRGKFVAVNQLMIMIGILSAQLMNWQISLIDTELVGNATSEMVRNSWMGQTGWRWMFGVEAIPAFLFFLMMLYMPDSVRWLVKNGQVERARKTLNRIGGEVYADSEIRKIQKSLGKNETGWSHLQKLLEPGILKILMLGFFLALLQQWSGMNVVFYYAADIFQAAGFDIHQMMLQIVWIGTTMVISVIGTILLVDKLGRKTLMLFGTAGLAGIYFIEGYFFQIEMIGLPILVLTLLSVAIYSFTLAPVLWIILSEIFPNHLRGAAMSLAAVMHWVGNFSLTFTFPSIQASLGWTWNFWLYGAICVFGFIIVAFTLIETKGKSLEQIEFELIGKRKSN